MSEVMLRARFATNMNNRPVCPDEATGLGVGYAGGGTALVSVRADGTCVVEVVAPAAVIAALKADPRCEWLADLPSEEDPA